MEIDVQWAELLQLMVSLLPQPGSRCQSNPIIHSEMFSFLSSPHLCSPGCLLAQSISVDPFPRNYPGTLGVSAWPWAQQGGHRADSSSPGGAELCPELLCPSGAGSCPRGGACAQGGLALCPSCARGSEPCQAAPGASSAWIPPALALGWALAVPSSSLGVTCPCPHFQPCPGLPQALPLSWGLWSHPGHGQQGWLLLLPPPRAPQADVPPGTSPKASAAAENLRGSVPAWALSCGQGWAFPGL